MRTLSIVLLVLICMASTICHSKPSLQAKPSEFHSSFADSKALTKLVVASLGQSLDSVYIEAGDYVSKAQDRAFSTRRFEVEVMFEEVNLVEMLKIEVERRLKNSGLQVRNVQQSPNGFSIDYASGSLVGSIDVRAVKGNGRMLESMGKTYSLFFIFHESYPYLLSASSSPKRNGMLRRDSITSLPDTTHRSKGALQESIRIITKPGLIPLTPSLGMLIHTSTIIRYPELTRTEGVSLPN